MPDPLPPIDASGELISVGASAIIPHLPDWLTHDLPTEDVANLRLLEGTTMQVVEIDEYGYVWFSKEGQSPWFCLRPNEIAVVGKRNE